MNTFPTFSTRPHPVHRFRLAAGLVPALLLAAFCGCQPIKVPTPPEFTAETHRWRFGREDGTLLVTPHYKIHTTVRDDEMLSVMPHFLETAHQLYMQLLPFSDTADTTSNLYVFRTRNQWERFTRVFSPRRANTYLRIRSGGYAEPNGTVLYNLRRRHYTFAVIAHECLHMYVYRNFPPRSVPPWLNEGLACYCEGHDWSGRTPRFTPGKNPYRMNAVRRALMRGSLFKLEEMLATNAGAVLRFSPKRVAAYYAQAWSLVAYLIHGKTYSESFARLRRELGTEKMRLTISGYLAARPTLAGRRISRGEALFRTYITDDFERFSAEYGVWLKKLVNPPDQTWRLFGSHPTGSTPDRPALATADRLRPRPFRPIQ